MTYSFDSGDGSGMGTCRALATTAAAGTLAATTLTAAGSVTYSTAGLYGAVIRIYTAAVCAAGATPTATLAITAAATISITVGGPQWHCLPANLN